MADAANSLREFTTTAFLSARIASNKKSRHSGTPEGFHHVGLLINSLANTHRHAIYLVVRIIQGLFRKPLATFCYPPDTVTVAVQIAMQFYHIFFLPALDFQFGIRDKLLRVNEE